MAEARYYYMNSNGESQGPFWLSHMRLLWSKGRINKRTEICREGTQNWEPVEFYPEIFEDEASLPLLTRMARAKSDNTRLLVWLVVLLLAAGTYFLRKWAE